MSHHLPRRTLLALVAGGGLLFVPAALAACSSPAASPTAAAKATAKPAATAVPAKPTAGAATKPAATTAAKPAAAQAPAKPKASQVKFLTPLRFLFSWVAEYTAKEGGFWKDQGIEVELIGGTGTSSVFQQLISKQVQLGRGSGITTIVAKSKEDVPIKGVSLVYQAIQFDLVSIPEKNIKVPADLKGKIIGVSSKGGATEQFTKLLGAAGGLSIDDVRTEVTSPGPENVGLMQAGRIDAFMATDSAIVTIESQNLPHTIIRTSQYVKMPADDWIVHQDTLKDDPGLVQAFVNGLQQARYFAMDPKNQDKVLEYTAKYTPDEVKDKALAGKQLESQVHLWTAKSKDRMGFYDPADWTAGQAALQKAGYIDKTLDINQFYTNDFMEKAPKS